MAIPANLGIDDSRVAFWTATVGANNLDADALYKKFLEIKTTLTNKSVADMEQVYWGGLATKTNMSVQDYKNVVFNPYQSEELYWLRAQP